MNMFSYRIHRRVAFAGVIVGAIALTGCQTTSVGPSAPPVPELKLLDSQPLTLAEACEASGSYFVEFVVLSDGRTGSIQAPEGPACVQQALTAWVSTFRYAPPGQQVPAGVEWMMVSGRRGP